jgi:hypothetical protein
VCVNLYGDVPPFGENDHPCDNLAHLQLKRRKARLFDDYQYCSFGVGVGGGPIRRTRTE